MMWRFKYYLISNVHSKTRSQYLFKVDLFEMYFKSQINTYCFTKFLSFTNYALKGLYTYLMSLLLLSEEFEIKSRAKNLAKNFNRHLFIINHLNRHRNFKALLNFLTCSTSFFAHVKNSCNCNISIVFRAYGVQMSMLVLT